eukprot:GCRY01002055.1.p1 GENE.GCRY01002055.1~~GCRY01002055.1.p1  ORF type:complete len:1057 (+),score=319.93 GCRY01002055.1:95-3172(+)
MSVVTSTSGVIALLHENEPELQHYALEELYRLSGQFWHEIADSVETIEQLFEDTSFHHRELAALLASKVYFHLGELDASLTYALGAGNLFDLRNSSEYTSTIVSKCIDHYILLRTKKQQDETVEVPPELEQIVEKMFEGCYENHEYKQALGIAFESRRLDQVEKALNLTAHSQSQLPNSEKNELMEIVDYCYECCVNAVSSLSFRHDVFALMVKLLEKEISSSHDDSSIRVDFFRLFEILVALNDTATVADLLRKLASTKKLFALQIAFDLQMNSPLHFLTELQNLLKAEEKEESTEGSSNVSDDVISQILSILSGEVGSKLSMGFLFRHCNTDKQLLSSLVERSSDKRNSIIHDALVFAQSIMYSGTTDDSFMRSRIEWFKKAKNWGKFSATASLGLIHRGHGVDSLTIMAPYLNKSANGADKMAEGGALYALGLMNTGLGGSIRDYLVEAVQAASHDEAVSHGGCLGLGLSAMASGNAEITDLLKEVLWTDNAVSGEAAGIALGLVNLGQPQADLIEELLNYAHDTQHEKIIRGIALGLALMMYAKEDKADSLILQLSGDKDPILRFGAMYMSALAYAGTAHPATTRLLLHAAVSDVSEDVRQAAVTAVGLVMIGNPEQVPKMVALLSESFNPYVRYGAALAIGFACAGTALPTAIKLLDSLTDDSEAFVRQGVLIAQAMVLMQSNESNPSYTKFTATLNSIVGDRYETVLVKKGAVMAFGILNAGGRNTAIRALTPSGRLDMRTVVSLFLFAQHWYWYPLQFMFGLALSPTALIALTGDLRLPKCSVLCRTAPSRFAYPPKMAAKKKDEAGSGPIATLSTTRRRMKENVSGRSGARSATAAVKKEKEKEVASLVEEKEKEKETKDEPPCVFLTNPCRITTQQQQFVTFEYEPEDIEKAKAKDVLPSRFRPMDPTRVCGFVVVDDLTPNEPLEYVALVEEEKEGEETQAQAQTGSKEEKTASVKTEKPAGSGDTVMAAPKSESRAEAMEVEEEKEEEKEEVKEEEEKEEYADEPAPPADFELE